MKILLISMPSIHAIRWIENLKDSPHELYWFDILSKGAIDVAGIHQLTNWNKRKIPYIKGEYFLSKKAPFIYKALQPFLEVTKVEAFEQIIARVKPDVVHSFEMQSCSYPLLPIMKKYPQIKWLYSCWGSDLFYYKQIKWDSKQIKKVLSRVNYLHTDCLRDYELAKQLGFKGKHVGVIPGGGGFKLKELVPFKKPLNERKIILVKGYEHTFGRALNVVKALQLLVPQLQNYEVVVFGPHQVVLDYINTHKLPYAVYLKHQLNHDALLTLMGKSMIYIGNSISDGMPNTLLEAICMGVFPIQSNPGGVTKEVITNYVNGILIDDPLNIQLIANHIVFALENTELLESSTIINAKLAQDVLGYKINQQKIIELYTKINN